MKLTDHPFYKKVIKDAWGYYTGAIILALLNISMFIVMGKPWGVTGAFATWGSWFWKAIGGQPEKWAYFKEGSDNAKALLETNFFSNGMSVQNIGIIVGALLAALLASQFRFKKIKSYKQVIAAVLGGLLMGYGARIAYGCNIGGLFSGIASMSLHGWIFGVFLFVGAFLGSKMLVKYFIT